MKQRQYKVLQYVGNHVDFAHWLSEQETHDKEYQFHSFSVSLNSADTPLYYTLWKLL